MAGKHRGLGELHAAVFLFGIAGLFGKWLALPAVWIVCGRAGFAAVVLGLVVLGTKQQWRAASGRDALALAALGALLAFHWTAFFHAIQLSSVAVGLLTFSTFPVFVTFLEPWFFGETLRGRDVAMAAAVAVGLALVPPSWDVGNAAARGAMWGVASGVSFAVLSVANRKYVGSYPAATIACWQNGIACAVVLPLALGSGAAPSPRDWLLLACLGVFCTALAHALFVHSLRFVRTQLASVTACLEPVYGIAFAWILLHDAPSTRTLLGGGIILAATIAATRMRGASEAAGRSA